ncbi:MAG: exodeoxyribonuclease VII large subunit [Lachnospiraceae bacterium]
MTKNIYSVGQVNKYIQNMFAQDFMMKRIYVKGEVSNCKYHSSGHIYFTLKDETGTLSAIMFAGQAKKMSFSMNEGDNVIVLGSIEVYERDGRYQIYAKEILPDGDGVLYQKYIRLKAELEEMGMFASEYKKELPRYIHTLGVVTAPTGAAVQDIRSISARRNPYVQVILYPAQVQGEGAAESIVKGIQALERLEVDLIIVGRGGGSMEDLWAFNEEIVARAIFDCGIPIISAVGHETDTTIADYVADLRAPTPSAGAELAVYDVKGFINELSAMEFTLNRFFQNKITQMQSRVEQLQSRLQYVNPQHLLHEKMRLVQDYEEQLEQLMNTVLLLKRHRLELLSGKLDGLSPLKKLSQGYSFVSDKSGRSVTDAEGVTPGDLLDIHMLNGTVAAIANKVIPVRRRLE